MKNFHYLLFLLNLLSHTCTLLMIIQYCIITIIYTIIPLFLNTTIDKDGERPQ